MTGINIDGLLIDTEIIDEFASIIGFEDEAFIERMAMYCAVHFSKQHFNRNIPAFDRITKALSEYYYPSVQ